MAGPLHYFMFPQREWLSRASVRRLSLAAKGLLTDLMAFQWDEGPLPNDAEALRRMVGAERKEFAPAWAEIRAMFEEDATGGLVVPDHEAKRLDAMQKVASRAECGKAGGRPKRTESKAEENQKLSESFQEEKLIESKPEPNLLVSNNSVPTEQQAGPAPVARSRGENHAFDPVQRVLIQVHSELGWRAPVDSDVRRGLKAESHLSELVAEFGEDGAVEMFVHAYREWSKPATWPAVFGQRNQLWDQLHPNGLRVVKGGRVQTPEEVAEETRVRREKLAR